MHRAIASYANGGAAPVLDDTTVLEQYGSLVERTAHRLLSRTGLRSAYDDLWSAGAIGLIEAGRRFDPTRGASFATFTEHRVPRVAFADGGRQREPARRSGSALAPGSRRAALRI